MDSVPSKYGDTMLPAPGTPFCWPKTPLAGPGGRHGFAMGSGYGSNPRGTPEPIAGIGKGTFGSTKVAPKG